MKTMTIALFAASVAALAADTNRVSIRFDARVNGEAFDCARRYERIGVTGSTLTPRDFRFYVHNIRLIDTSGAEYEVDVDQDGKWQLDGMALLDFENASGSCSNGTPEMNAEVKGSAPAGKQWQGLRFTLGVPFEKNHTDITKMPPPLNLTALSWVWNAGRKFARLDFSSTGLPRGVAIHLGSTGCTPSESKTTVPHHCTEPNRAEVYLRGFDPGRDVVVADLGRLLKDSNIDTNQEKTPAGCMSGVKDMDCAPIFANLGLVFGDQPAREQSFFAAARGTAAPATSARAR